MNIKDLRKLREQIASGEALVRPESVIIDVIDTAIVALHGRNVSIEAAQHAGKEHAEMEDLLCDLGDKYAPGWEEMADIPMAIGARIEKAEAERDGARARIEKLYRAFVLVRTDKPHWRCRCGAVAMPLTDESPCFCEELYEEEWVRIDPCAKANGRVAELETQVAALREELGKHLDAIQGRNDDWCDEHNIKPHRTPRPTIFTDTATAAEAHDARVREPLEKRIAELEEECAWVLEAAQLADYLGENVASATACIREYLDALHDVMSYLQERSPHDLVDAIKKKILEARAEARRKVLEDLLMLCNRSATEAAAEGRKFSLDIHQGYENWAEGQLAALDADKTKGEG